MRKSARRPSLNLPSDEGRRRLPCLTVHRECRCFQTKGVVTVAVPISGGLQPGSRETAQGAGAAVASIDATRFLRRQASIVPPRVPGGA